MNNDGAASAIDATGADHLVATPLSLTVDGPVTVAISSVDRWTVFDINGGTFNANNPGVGVYLGGAVAAGNVIMHVRNAAAVANVPGIQFGQADFGGRSLLNLAAGALYVGPGGLNIGTTNESFQAGISLAGGTLGATANWSSTIPVTLVGNVSLTAADAADTPYTVALHGTTSGIGGLTKQGSGTVLLTSPANDYFGPTVVESGTLGLAGRTTDLVTVNPGATLALQGVLTVDFGAAINGRLSVGYNAAAETPVNRIQSSFDITLGAESSLDLSGSGILPGPAHVIVKAGLGITGTFASVTGIPPGFVLDYNYDDGSGVPVIALVGAGVGSPYDTWTTTNGLSGDNALRSADPDADGLSNLLEYALGTSPTVSDAGDAYTLGRSGNFLTLAFDHPGDPSLTYQIEATNDLSTPWQIVHTYAPFVTAGTETHTDDQNLTTTPRRFLRLVVTATP